MVMTQRYGNPISIAPQGVYSIPFFPRVPYNQNAFPRSFPSAQNGATNMEWPPRSLRQSGSWLVQSAASITRKGNATLTRDCFGRYKKTRFLYSHVSVC